MNQEKIREVALRIAGEMNTFCRTEYDGDTYEGYEFSEAELPEFLTRCLAALSKDVDQLVKANEQLAERDLDEFVQRAVEQEREACAALCESLFDADDDTCREAETCAAAIRGRGK